MNAFELYNSTKVVFGEDRVSRLGELVQPFGKRILLVYGGGSIKNSGLYDQVKAQLAGIDTVVHELPGIEPNPRLSTVNKGIQICRDEDIQFILAVGGGSVIDAAKAIAAGALYDGDVWDFTIGKAVVKQALPLGTILTLAATGSEMNGNSVISNWETKQKRAFGSRLVYPKFSILDPKLTYTVPVNQTVNGIVDIMSHVFEQYFSLTTDTPLQERFGESILLTVIENGEKAIANGSDYNARANLLLAGTYALNGTLPIGVVTDWATHGIEHEVSAIYDIAHGAGLAIIFPNWMKYVYKERVDRFVQFAVRVWGVDANGKTDDEIALEGIEATRAYFTRIGAPATLGELGINDENIQRMAEEATQFGPIGSYKKLAKEDVVNILKASL
ncbi:iron-containing alcohol dehydrogenase [Paenibacillus sp. GCM10012307]|uniref:Iron-containing alcohol dehydrogenase n=1 Tax=Paenibacillus roseus TaxID=2798579 RepID=A0A934J4Q8_9BACL|nr:iron-containing alcohol dehydrogenase [Paenibacillus roseus]MBJ6362835.1 iron-containing alcohol dehydrogenase [Paenibacillus roseus]